MFHAKPINLCLTDIRQEDSKFSLKENTLQAGGHGSNCTLSVQQVQGPEFKPQHQQKKTKTKKQTKTTERTTVKNMT
jgi:hypothetical protein